MAHPETAVKFDEKAAAAYDERFIKIVAMRDALHLLVRAVLSELPADARILCVGAGTGAELLTLATHYPRWHFTAVEPSAPMMALCQRRAAEHGFADRCTFHTGYLDSLPPTEPFHAVTSLLVSHFITDKTARLEYFHQIGARLRPRGWLINADLSGDQSTDAHTQLEQAWFRLMTFTGQTEEKHASMHAAYRKDVAFLPIPELENLIVSAGFEQPALFFQALLIRAWFTRRLEA